MLLFGGVFVFTVSKDALLQEKLHCLYCIIS